MALLREDGSLDVEWINNLPINEKMKIIPSLTIEQKNEYWAKIPINESNDYPRTIITDKPITDYGVDATEFINNMRVKYGTKK